MSMELDFAWEERPWERAFSAMPRGARLPVGQFLAMMAQYGEEEAEEAIQLLTSRDVLLDVSQVPVSPARGAAGQRLALEWQLARQGNLRQELPEGDLLAVYLEEVDNTPALSEPQLEAMAREAALGNETAAQSLTAGALHLAVEEAMAFAGKGVLLLDLIQESSLALWQAVADFDGEGSFLPVARLRIRQAMAAAVTLQYRQSDAGAALVETFARYRRTEKALLSRLGRTPSTEEMSLELNMAPEEVQRLEKLLRETELMSKARDELQGEPQPEEDTPVEDSAYFQQRMLVEELLSGLPELDRQILLLRFGLEGKPPASQQEVASLLNLPVSEVLRREENALSAIRLKNNH